MNLSRREFYSEWVNQNCHDNRKLFQEANMLRGLNQQQQQPPSLSDDVISSQKFADFFTQKIDNIMASINSLNLPPHSSLLDPSIPTTSLFTTFQELSDQDITSLVKSTNKTCDADPIPSWIVKPSIQILTPVLKKLINTCLKTGHFCSSWKRAIIRPKVKKRHLDPVLHNYHPLSNLPFVSKLEKTENTSLYRGFKTMNT